MDVVYASLRGAGRSPASSTPPSSRIMSTHYGRMIHEDDRTIMFANPEDAAEYIGLTCGQRRLTPSPGDRELRNRESPGDRDCAIALPPGDRDCAIGIPGSRLHKGDALVHAQRREYFIVDSHMHYGTAPTDNWVPGAEQYAKGWIECFHAYRAWGRRETHWPIEKFQKYSEDDLIKDVFEDGYVTWRSSSHLLEGVVQGGLQHHRAQRGTRRRSTWMFHRQHPVGPRDAMRAWRPLRRNVERYGSRGGEAVHRRVEQRLARLEAVRPGAYRYWRPARSSHQEHPRAQGPDHLGRWTRTRSTSPTWTTRRRLP